MTQGHIRGARLDDAGAISALFRARIGVWQRMDADGSVEDLPYDALTIYERWLHGDGHSNPWMSIETAAIWLSHLLRGAGMPLVVDADGTVIAYAEVYHGVEPPPYGDHLHLAYLVTHPDADEAALKDRLMRHLPGMAESQGCERVAVTVPGFDSDSAAFYSRYGMKALARIRRYSIPARTGQSFYKATEHLDPDPAQITGWRMSLGRLQSARQQWETFWPGLWDAIPEMASRRIHRLRVNASGHDAFICCHQQLYLPRSASIYAWSPRPISGPLLIAIRDWAHREGYRTLVLALADDAEEVQKLLGPDAEAEPHHYEIHAAEV